MTAARRLDRVSARRARGASSAGCLISLLVIGLVGYLGVSIGHVYWRFYQYQDEMRQEIRFGASRTNEQIVTHLRAFADSMDLPDGAKKISIRRSDKGLSLEAEYFESVQLPLYEREIRLHPHAESTP